MCSGSRCSGLSTPRVVYVNTRVLMYGPSFKSALPTFQPPVKPPTMGAPSFHSILSEIGVHRGLLQGAFPLQGWVVFELSHLGELFAGLKPFSGLHGCSVPLSLEIYVVIEQHRPETQAEPDGRNEQKMHSSAWEQKYFSLVRGSAYIRMLCSNFRGKNEKTMTARCGASPRRTSTGRGCFSS